MGACLSYHKHLAQAIDDPIIVYNVTLMIQADEDWSALFEAQHIKGRLDCLNDIAARKNFLFNKGSARWKRKNRALTAVVKDYVVRHRTWCEVKLAEGKTRINGDVQPPVLPFFFGNFLEEKARDAGGIDYRNPMRVRSASW